ncbi:MAG: acetylxylan esterase [Armatimonadota bacterium]
MRETFRDWLSGAGAPALGRRALARQAAAVRLLLFGALLLLTAGLRAEPVRPAPAVQIAPRDKGFLITTPEYKATVGADGNLHSLLVGDVEFLDDRVLRSAGSSFFLERPIGLPKMSTDGRALTATDGTYSVIYEFEEGYLSLTLRHTSPKGAAYVVICSSRVAYVENLAQNGLATVPADYDWPDVKISTTTGEALELSGGTRVWSRGLGRQVWERSNIAPNKDYTLTIIPRRGAPVAPTLSQLIALTPSLAHPNNLVPVGETPEVQVKLENNSLLTLNADMVIQVDSSTGGRLFEGQKGFSCQPHHAVTLAWTLSPKEPDIYTITYSVNVNGTITKKALTFGYDVYAIKPSVQRPDDFTAYWERVVAEAKAPEVKLTRLEETNRSTPAVTAYRVGMDVGGTTWYGWLSVPKFPGRYPGLLQLPSDRIRVIMPNNALAECGFVVLTIEPTGQTVEGRITPLNTLLNEKMSDASAFALRGAIIRYLQALTALASVPEVDAQRLGVTGLGMGGSMALVLAALDDRVQAVAPDLPYYCFIERGIDSPKWPYSEIAVYLRKYPDQREAVLRTLRYFDTANFTTSITCPVFINAGISDYVPNLASIFGLYNRLPGPRAIKVYLAGGEGINARLWEDKIDWLRRVLGTPAFPAAGGGQ